MMDKEKLSELSEGKAIIYTAPGYDAAFIGVGYQNLGGIHKHFAVYDYELMINDLTSNHDMTRDEAIEFIDFNTLNTGGDNFPVILYKSDEDTQDNLSDLIDIPQAAELLLVSERTLYGWCKDKTIPSFKIGNMWRFSRKDLDTFIEQRKTVSY